MSERLSKQGKVGAETIVEVIESCFTRLLEVATSFGGTLIQFGGDAVLLFFRGDGHELRAAAAALEMRRTMRSLGDLTRAAAGVRLSMTVGVHSGDFDWFLVGRSHRQLVLGGAAASELVRLEGAAERGQILVGPVHRGGSGRAEPGRRGRGRTPACRAPSRLRRTSRSAAAAPGAWRRSSPPVSAGPWRRAGCDSEHRTATVAFVQYGGLDEVIEQPGETRRPGVSTR